MHKNIDKTKNRFFGNNLCFLHQEGTRKSVFSVIYDTRYNSGRDIILIDHYKYKSKHSSYAESKPYHCWGVAPLNATEGIISRLKMWYEKWASVYATTHLLWSKNN